MKLSGCTSGASRDGAGVVEDVDSSATLRIATSGE